SVCCADDENYCTAANVDQPHAHDAPPGNHEHHAPGCPAMTTSAANVLVLRPCLIPVALSVGSPHSFFAVAPAPALINVTSLAELFHRPVYLLVRALLI